MSYVRAASEFKFLSPCLIRFLPKQLLGVMWRTLWQGDGVSSGGSNKGYLYNKKWLEYW